MTFAQTVLVLKYVIPDYQNPEFLWWGVANVLQSLLIMTRCDMHLRSGSR